MSLDEEALETAAAGGLMEYEKWPAMVEPFLERLEQIVYNAFPMPRVPPESPQRALNRPLPPIFPTSSQPQDPLPIPNNVIKENPSAADLQTPPRPAAPPVSTNSPSIERVPDSQPSPSPQTTSATLPEPLVQLLNSIKTTIQTYFTSRPPHTIQRLAELILRPNAHYRTLPAYLRAVDRVVSVTSGADIFPFPAHSGANQPNGLMNGAASGGSFMMVDNSLGSDESLGGALLTPIPWLTYASVEREGDGLLAGGVEPDSLAEATTLPQQDQQPSDLLTASSLQSDVVAGSDPNIRLDSPPAQPTTDPSDEFPHARGPPIVGVEDMGLQDGKGVEMALEEATPGTASASGSTTTITSSSTTTTSTIPSADKVHDGNDDQSASQGAAAAAAAVSASDADGDGDIVLDDAKDDDDDGSKGDGPLKDTTTTIESGI